MKKNIYPDTIPNSVNEENEDAVCKVFFCKIYKFFSFYFGVMASSLDAQPKYVWKSVSFLFD